jgi:hypothetical protein
MGSVRVRLEVADSLVTPFIHDHGLQRTWCVVTPVLCIQHP